MPGCVRQATRVTAAAAPPPPPPPLQAAVDGMERQAQQAQRFVRQDRSLTPAVCAVAAGPVPSVNQCLQGLQDIWCAGR